MRTISFFTRRALIGILLVFSNAAFSQMAEEVCNSCSRKVLVTGQFRHGSRDNAVIVGAAGMEGAFREEIRGREFTTSIPGLPAGKYTVVLGFAELHFDAPDRRLFDIVLGDQTIRTNLDIFVLAGGKDRVGYVTNQLEHSGDAVRGPVQFRFVARKDNAKLNTLELKDANGTVLVAMRAADLVTLEDPAALVIPQITGPIIYRDTTKPIKFRVQDLVSRMSLAEKVAQMRNNAPAIPRLGVPAYDYWNECLHGVGRAGVATVFPQAIGMAATWDVPLLHNVADAIATEARAKHHQYVSTNNGNSAKYYGLTFWTPNINIFRDPRWGRGQETYGEDPFLTARLAVAFIRGLQGDDPNYVKAMACAKHFAVHSGPESNRHQFDAVPSAQDFYDTYLPQFEAAVREAKVGAVMGAYNRVYGEPACSNRKLLDDLLRTQWGFEGHVVSDCGAIFDIYANHKVVPTAEEAAARAVKNGCDLCCGADYGALTRAVKKGLITETEIDQALSRVLAARFRLGLFDPSHLVPYAQIPFEKNDCAEHQTLALRTARESIVLLKNDGLLPLDRKKVRRIAVIGTNADAVGVLLGNYNGTPSKPVTILDGIRQVAGPKVEVLHASGYPLALRSDASNKPTPEMLLRAVSVASSADVVIYVGGLSPQLEGEEMRVDYQGFAGGDRTAIELPEVQTELLKQLQALGKPIVYVNCSGSAVAFPWAAENLPAILQVWYPGGMGGQAVGEVLFGEINPAGRLPVTFYEKTADLPGFEDYSMQNRTYRYFNGKPLFAFGHGLSYTRFEYLDPKLDRREVAAGEFVRLSLKIKNLGIRDGEEVPQIYFRRRDGNDAANLTLCNFVRLRVPKLATANLAFEISTSRFREWNATKGHYIVPPGEYEVLVGASAEDVRVNLPLTIVSGE